MALTLKAPEGCHLTTKILIAAAFSKAAVKVENVTRDKKKGYDVATPLKKVPALETEAGVLFESNAIARFVAKQNGNPANLFGKSAVEAAQVDSWISFASNEIQLPINSWVWSAQGKTDKNPAAEKAGAADARKILNALNQHLNTKTFLVGERITLADIVVASALKDAFIAVFDGKLRKPFKNVSRWFVTIANQAEVASVFGSVTLCGEKAACNTGASSSSDAGSSSSAPAADDDDDDFDVFGDDDDDEEHQNEIQRIADEAAKAKAAKLAAAGKAAVVAKSVVVIDVKPWDTETDLKALEDKIRGIEMKGLEWKGAELKPVAYGLKKIVIMSHIVDAEVSVDDLQEKISEFEDDVQSTDVVTFTKL